MTTRLKYFFVAFYCYTHLWAQDPQFTQFYASPLYLNPAFTGLTFEHRFTVNYRNQWPGITRAYTTYMAGYDYNLSNLNSGIGAYVLQDRSGISNLVTTLGALNYAYRFKITRNSEVRCGIGIGIAQKKLDFTKLIFNDQLITGESVSQEARNVQQINYADLSAGALYNSIKYWFGISARHLNQPNISMVGNTEPLPVSLSVHGGYRYIIASSGSGKSKLENYISICANFRKEQNYDQLDIGAYYFKSIMNVGVWYRGLPFKTYKPGYPSRESVAILLGLEIPDKFRIGYSYDLTVSNLGLGNTQGAHEVSLIFEIAKKNKRMKRVLVSCPKF